MLTEEKDDIWVPNSRFHWQEMRVSRTCVSAVSAETKPAVSQLRSHLHRLRKSLAVARNPWRHIFNLPLSYHGALTHSTWIMCITIYLPSSPSLASARTTRVSSGTSQYHHKQRNAPHTSNVCLPVVFLTQKKAISMCPMLPPFWAIFTEHECVRVCVIISLRAEAVWVGASLVFLVLTFINIYDKGF